MAEAGRHPIEIPLRELERLGKLHVTLDELAAWFGVSAPTIDRRMKDAETRYEHRGFNLTFREIFERGQAAGKVSLRRSQLALALKGNATAQIWLGKQLLGQRDNLELSGPNSGPISFIAKLNAGRERARNAEKAE